MLLLDRQRIGVQLECWGGCSISADRRAALPLGAVYNCRGKFGGVCAVVCYLLVCRPLADGGELPSHRSRRDVCLGCAGLLASTSHRVAACSWRNVRHLCTGHVLPSTRGNLRHVARAKTSHNRAGHEALDVVSGWHCDWNFLRSLLCCIRWKHLRCGSSGTIHDRFHRHVRAGWSQARVVREQVQAEPGMAGPQARFVTIPRRATSTRRSVSNRLSASGCGKFQVVVFV